MATLTVDTLADDLYDGGDLAAETTDDGGLSLREALALASGGDRIEFDVSLITGPNDGHLILTNGTLTVSDAGLIIDGDINADGKADITLDGNNASTFLGVLLLNVIGASATTVNGLVIQNGNATARGGGVYVSDNNTLNLTNSVIQNNTAGLGGGVFMRVTAGLVAVNSTLSGNTATIDGGGIYVYQGGQITLVNSTISGNKATGASGTGGIYADSQVTLTNSTVTGNSGGKAGGLANYSVQPLTLTNSIIAGNQGAVADDLMGEFPLKYLGHNIIGSTPLLFGGGGIDTSDGDVTQIDGADPAALRSVFAHVGNNPNSGVLSGVLADNGGAVPTVALNPAGIAHDTGIDAKAVYDDDRNGGTPDVDIPTDARGFARVADAHVDVGAFEVQAALTVDTLTDEDYDGGDVAAEMADGDGLSLREALALANLDPASPDIINFDLSLITGFNDGRLFVDNGELTIASNVTINGDVDGDGRGDITLDADLNSRVVHVTGGVSTLNALTVTGGAVTGLDNGGGILIDQTAALTVNNSIVAGNHAGGSGGGIFNDGLLTLNNSLIAANTALAAGGISNEGTATAFLTNTTIYGNSADIAVGGMSNNGTATLTNVTVTGNAAGSQAGGLGNTGTLTLTNSIVAGNDALATADFAEAGGGTTTFNGHNLFSQAGVGGVGDTDGADITDIFRDTGTVLFTGADGGLLDDNGGPTPTVAIKTGGLAHNAAGTALPGDVTDANQNGDTGESLPIDARGFARDVDGVDIGAVEIQNGATYTVTTLDDEEFDGGDLAAELADGGGLSLREALALTNADPLSADTIRFSGDLLDTGPLTLLHGTLVITSDVEITGDVSGGTDRDITIDAGGNSRVFSVISGAVTLNGLVMTNGEADCGCDPGYGGAVQVGSYLYSLGKTAQVTISNSTVSNSAAYYGGGISVDVYSSLRLVNSTVTGNSADIGGGIHLNIGATLTTIDTTISDNQAVGTYGYGGGLANYGGTATLINTTLSANSATAGGGIYNSHELTLINVTLANNTAEVGGGLYNTPCGCATADIFNSTITGNFASESGGGIAHLAGTLGITNSIVAGNGSPDGPDLYSAGTVNYAGRNVFSQDGVGGIGDIFAPDVTTIFTNVVLVDPTPDDGDEFFAGQLTNGGGLVETVAIKATGVAWNAGLAADLPPDTEDINGNNNTTEDLPVDARGVQRIYGAGLDIGAFELIGSPPFEVTNSPLVVTEGGSGTITPSELAFSDAEQPNVTYTITSLPTAGVLFRAGTPLGLGSTFTQSDIDNFRIDYTHDSTDAPSVSFGFSVDDGVGNVVTGQTFTFTINPVNDPPVNTVPGTVETEANTNTAIAGISIADDSGAGPIATTLSVTHGTLTITAAAGVTVGGNGTASVTLAGALSDINDTLGAANGVVYRGAHDFFGTDTLTVNTNDNGNTGGGALSDIDSFDIHLNTLIIGTSGDDSYDALPGQERIEAGGGTDTISFNFRLVDAHVTYESNRVIIDGPSGSHTVLTGFEIFKFTDGTVNNNDGSPLIDDLFYYSTYHDVWTAHADADSHFNSVGWKEGRDPSAFFNTVVYLSANPDVKAGGLNPLTHFDLNGWKEGRVPSLTFDPKAYLAANPDVAAAHVDPLLHYLSSGYQEGRQPIAPTELIAPVNGFDYVYYLSHNPDVAASHVDPFQHFQTVGWKEGRNPNALFDVNGYLNTYIDVKNGGMNPLDHYNQFGWKEGRDPSVGFDTTSYLAAYNDVNAAHVNPLTHFLTYGIHEGRLPFADGVWG